ncbi:MAG: cardiolipin synthase [Eubacteriales bacterium]|nr:cardiolipin synthase [Eubacteriales bacterium]
MKNLKNLLLSKVPIVILLILMQLGWFLWIFKKLRNQAHWVNFALGVLTVLMFLAILMSNQNPSYKIGWIVLIGVVPLLGGLLYLLFGNKRPARRLQNKILAAEARLDSLAAQDPKLLKGISERDAGLSRYILSAGAYPISGQTKTEYFKLGEEMFERMLEDLNSAENYIFFEYFIVGESSMWERMKEVLIRKAKAGLDVRVMYDELGSLPVLPQNFRRDLTAAGIQVVNFNPLVPFLSMVMNNRDHRKILSIDGRVAYTGGINIADEYININPPYGHWKDTGLRLEGEGAWTLTTMYLGLWLANLEDEIDYSTYRPELTPDLTETENLGLVQPFSDSPLGQEALGLNVYLDIIWQAEDYVYIFTPYLIIDYEMIEALSLAARRGVDVRIVVPGIPDKKLAYELTQSYFRILLEAGVKIYLYSPGFIHAKSFLSDHKRAVVGTINMDFRSLYLHFECGVLMLDTPCLKDLHEDYLDVFAKSKLLSLEDLAKNPLVQMKRAVLRVVSTMF